MTAPETELRPTPPTSVEAELTPETIAARLEKLPFATLRTVLEEAERLASNTWQEGPDGFKNIRGGSISVFETRSDKFKLEVNGEQGFNTIFERLLQLRETEFESVADAKAAARKILDELRVRIIE